MWICVHNLTLNSYLCDYRHSSKCLRYKTSCSHLVLLNTIPLVSTYATMY